MQTATRRIQFCAGHRVAGHESKCAHLHGHNYVVFVTARTENYKLDDVGRVVDFAVLKERIGSWIEKNWDHGFLLHKDDAIGRAAVEGFKNERGEPQKTFVMPYNPTAENLAQFILFMVGPHMLAGTGCLLVEVRVEETENCSAVATLPNLSFC